MRIYLACFKQSEEAFFGFALADNGEALASHLSSSEQWSKHDMGLTSDWKHDHYTKCFPEGFELIWIGSPENDDRWQKALLLNKECKVTHDEEMCSVKLTFKK